MSKRMLRSDDEEGFLRAFRDELIDLAEYYGVRIEATLRLPVMGSGLFIYLEAFKRDLEGAEQVYAAAEQAYPTPAAARLHAALYRASIRLGGALSARRQSDRQEDSSSNVPAGK
jgi:hypothetical protein